MYNFNRDLIYFIKRDGTTENPYQNITESMTVLYEKAFLQEVPVQAFKVVVKIGSTTLTEVQKPENVKSSTQYYVNYKQGIVYFHSSRNNSLATLTYRGQGVLLYPASRIYVDGEYGARDVVKTLKDLINEGAEALDAVTQLNDVIDRADIALDKVDVAVVNSNDAVSRINQKISEVNTAEATRVTNENTRKTNESSRVAKETERQNAETLRASKEAVRMASEDDRVENENTRQQKENLRISAENARDSKEIARSASETARKEAEDTRVTNENERKSNESSRISAESARVSVEITRVNAELERKSNEDTRKSNEVARVDAEVLRKSSESARATSETARKSNEDIRISNENTRESNEDTRIENEIERLDNEDVRVDSENTRISSENQRISNESTRELNENSRISEEAIRVTNENVRKSNEILRASAETARENAESIRQSQESQRQTTFQNQVASLDEMKQTTNGLILEAETIIDEANQSVENVETLISDTVYSEEFNIDSTYKKNNIVSYNGSSYIAKQETTGNLPTNLVYWGLLAVRGVDGTGAVSTVNNISPDANGNVVLSAEQLGAERVSRKGIADGYAGLDSNAKVPLANIPDVLKQQVYVVVDSAERLALTNVISGDKAYETSTGNSYIHDGNEWLMMADADWENVSLEWINIVNKPTSTVESIDLAVLESHAHANIEILEKFSFVEGKLKYDGVDVGNVLSVNGMTGAVTLTASTVGAYSKAEVDALSSSLLSNVNSRIPNSEKGVANGVARLNASGKVVDASGNEVEGKVRSVNGMTGDVIGLETVENSDTRMNNHKEDSSFMHVEILDSEPTTFDKSVILFIRKGVVDESPSNIDAGLFTHEDDGSPMDLGLFNYGDDGDSIDEGTF